MRVTARLELNVTYVDTTPEEAHRILGNIASNASNRGLLTDNSDAVVEEWDYETHAVITTGEGPDFIERYMEENE